MKIDLFSCLGQSSSETHKLQPFERLFGYAMNNWIYNHNVIGFNHNRSIRSKMLMENVTK